jgi:hypothetical protein
VPRENLWRAALRGSSRLKHDREKAARAKLELDGAGRVDTYSFSYRLAARREPPAPCVLYCRRLGGKRGESVMHQILSQILHLLQQGIAAIFRFIELIWTWSVDQVTKLAAVPWSDWPILKVILLVVVVVAVVWALYRVFWELWLGTERVLSSFARLLVVFVQTLPRVLLAGVIALGGLWLMNHLDNATMRIPASLQVWQQQPQQPPPQAQPQPQQPQPPQAQPQPPQAQPQQPQAQPQ